MIASIHRIKEIFLITLTLKNKSDKEQLVLYHGTTESYANLIINRGIHLRLRWSRGGDFGYGFYTTDDFIAATKYAQNRAQKANERPACLVFCIPKDVFNAHEIFRLLYDEHDELDIDE